MSLLSTQAAVRVYVMNTRHVPQHVAAQYTSCCPPNSLHAAQNNDNAHQYSLFG